jgi:cytochrome P450
VDGLDTNKWIDWADIVPVSAAGAGDSSMADKISAKSGVAERGPVIEFDHHGAEFAERGREIYGQLRDRCPVAYTASHGGYWVLSRYQDVARVARDDATFTSTEGITIPPSTERAIPIDMDPPESEPYRRLLLPYFSPAAVEYWAPRIARWGEICVDQVIERGEIDLILDLANPLPALFTCEFLGLPIENWAAYARPMHEIVYSIPGTSNYDKAVHGLHGIVESLRDLVKQERKHPSKSLLGDLVQARVEDELLSDETIVGICHLIMSGGFDTTTSLAGNIFKHLDDDHGARRKLIEQQDLLDSAVDEYLRFFSPQTALARTAMTDTEVGGVRIKKGERVLLAWSAANHDPAAFDEPEKIDFERFPNRHQAFGLGVHRCLGSHFARNEMITMLREVLTRLPDFRLGEGATRYPSIGIVNGWIEMPATFTPGARKFPGERLPSAG